jgi:hypothetical protein
MKRRRSYNLIEKSNIQKRALNREQNLNNLKPYLCENHENNRSICKIYQCAGIPNIYELELSSLVISKLKHIPEPVVYMQDVLDVLDVSDVPNMPNMPVNLQCIKPAINNINCSYIN